MKKTQRDPVYKIDEFEDLTLYANESFDTQDVDLFEFSSEESSPLARLKSIILSLDWEINDEILQELADELVHLESQWQGDKVAEVYLQGLKKIGGYIRSKGAYAHPNSIKLLLTFFYNFEKIISSQEITGDEITELLASDVKKFRILQYQISLIEEGLDSGMGNSLEGTIGASEGSASALIEHIKHLKAAILGLDWEVTPESLNQYNDQVALLYEVLTDNKPALVLVQGLQVLGDYIGEKGPETHPEAFVLLHSFNDGLELLITGGQSLDQETIQDILADRISRINNLKMLVSTSPHTPLAPQAIDTIVDEISAPPAIDIDFSGPPEPVTNVEPIASLSLEKPATVSAREGVQEATLEADSLEAELDSLFGLDAKPAMETADTQYPDEILPPEAIQPVEDELADDFIEAELSAKRGLQPALSDTDEIFGFNEEAEPLDIPAQMDLDEQLDLLFAEATAESEAPTGSTTSIDETTLATSAEDEEQPVLAALADVEQEEAFVGLDGEDETGLDHRELGASELEQSALDIQAKLDDFFNEPIEEAVAPDLTAAASIEDIEQSLFFDEEKNIETALADINEEQGFSEEAAVASLEYTPMDEIEEKLDFFFGADTEEEPLASVEENTQSTEKIASKTAVIFDSPLADFELSENAAPDENLEFFLDAVEDDEEETAPLGADALAAAQSSTTGLKRAPALSEEVSRQASPGELGLGEDRDVQLAALGALLPGIVRAASPNQIAESEKILAAIEKSAESAEQRALAQLLNAVVGLRARLPLQDSLATEKLVNYIFEHLYAHNCSPEVLPHAVNLFTAWQQHAYTLMPVLPAKTEREHEPHFEYTAKELYFELSELRGSISREFAKLHHALHHKH